MVERQTTLIDPVLFVAWRRSLLLRRACVGDEEDLPYAKFAVGGLTSKMSSTFKIDGLTGSANGHFGTSGGGLRQGVVKAWKRFV